MIKLGTYRKFLVALGAAVAILVKAAADGSLSGEEMVAVAMAFLGSLGVYGFKNDD